MHCFVITEHPGLRSRGALHLIPVCVRLAFRMLPGGCEWGMCDVCGALILWFHSSVKPPFHVQDGRLISCIDPAKPNPAMRKRNASFLFPSLFIWNVAPLTGFAFTWWGEANFKAGVCNSPKLFEFHYSNISSAFSYPSLGLWTVGCFC